MKSMMRIFPALALSTAAAACVPVSPEEAAQLEFSPEYGLVSTRLLENELVNIKVQMEGARFGQDVIAFNDCAAAQYAIIRGSAFVRRVKNEVEEQGGIWIGNGVYTLSDAHPGGTFTIDAEVVAADCKVNNIPMV